jgi:outer membrane protein TolC
MYTKKLIIFYFLLFSAVLFCAPSGDLILQEREARLNQLREKLSPMNEKKRSSSLSGIEKVDGVLELVSPDESTKSYSLMEAAKEALKNNDELEMLEMELEKGASQELIALKEDRMSVSFNGGINRAGNIGNDPATEYTRRIVDLSHQEDSYYGGFDFSYNLMDGGVSQGRWQKQQLYSEMLKLDYKEKKQEIILDVANIYIQLILVEEELDVSSYEIEKARFHLAELERNPLRDERFPVEVLEAKVELESLLNEEFALRNRRIELQNHFASLLDLPADEQFVMDKNAKTKILNDTVENLESKSVHSSLLIKRAKLEKAMAEAEHSSLKAKEQPKLDLFGKMDYSRLMDRARVDEVRYLAGVTVDWNLFDGNVNRSRQRISNQNRAISENRVEYVTLKVKNGVRYQFQKFLDASNRLASSINNIRLAKQVLYEAEERFEKKQLSRLKLLNSRLQYKKAILNYYHLLGDMILSKLQVFKQLGELDENVFG